MSFWPKIHSKLIINAIIVELTFTSVLFRQKTIDNRKTNQPEAASAPEMKMRGIYQLRVSTIAEFLFCSAHKLQ